MKLCCRVNPYIWCYQCSRQFCETCLNAFKKRMDLDISRSKHHHHQTSGAWDFFEQRELYNAKISRYHTKRP